MKQERIESLDLLRGLAIILILLFHSSIYNFANIHLLDFSNPPIIVVLMSFMGLWGGIFIIYSMLVNTFRLPLFQREGLKFTPFRYLLITGGLLLVAHYLLNIILGRWNVDFVHNQPVLTMTADFFRHGTIAVPKMAKFLDGSILSTIGLNLIFLSLFEYYFFRNKSRGQTGKFYLIAGIAGTTIMLLSFVRVYIHPFFAAQAESGNYFATILLSFFLANPYPLIPYLAYGIFGMMAGLMILENRNTLFRRVMIPAGLFFLVYGFTGMTYFDKTISKPDFFWYFKTNFELGVFLLMIVFSRFIPAAGSLVLRYSAPIRWFSRVSLTVYLLETTLSEITRIIGLNLFPGWNETINGCLKFGAVNILIWTMILFFWRKVHLKYSLEYFWVKLFSKLGKSSTKLDLNSSTM